METAPLRTFTRLAAGRVVGLEANGDGSVMLKIVYPSAEAGELAAREFLGMKAALAEDKAARSQPAG